MGSKTGETCTLQISGVTEKMSGVYKCVATNKDGTIEHKTVVTVVEKPKETSDKPKEESQNTIGEVNEATSKEPKTEVLKTEEDLKPKEEEKPKPKTTTEAPVFTEAFEEVTVRPKSTLTLTAKVTGKPEPTVTWFRDDKEIQ